MSVQITKEDFVEYERVRRSGKFNMIMNWSDAIAETNLSYEQWKKIMKHYQTFYDSWIDDETDEELNNED